MTGILRSGPVLAAFLSAALIIGTFGGMSVNAQGRHRGRSYGRHHHSRGRGALVVGAVGLIGGALLGGGRGALIGAGTGAGTGYMIQRYRNHRRRPHYYWRH